MNSVFVGMFITVLSPILIPVAGCIFIYRAAAILCDIFEDRIYGKKKPTIDWRTKL